jgi:phage terminase large subunit
LCSGSTKEIRVLDYYEAQGQVLAEHAHWLRSRGWEKATNHLPHDGVNTNNITGKRYVDHWREAGFNCIEPAANAGTGAAMQRVEAVRNLFPRVWFDADKTEAGRAALGWYHARYDEERGTDLGPEHDWSSHAADAFGEMCLAYREPEEDQDDNDEWTDPSRSRSVAGYG